MLLTSNCALPTKGTNWNRLLVSLALKVKEWAASLPETYLIQAAKGIAAIKCHWFLTSVFLLGAFWKAWKMLLHSVQPFGTFKVARTRGAL